MAALLMANHTFTPSASATGEAMARPAGIDSMDTIWNAEKARPSFCGSMALCM